MIARSDLRGFQASLRKMQEVGKRMSVVQRVALGQLAVKTLELAQVYVPKDTLVLTKSARLEGDGGSVAYSNRLGDWVNKQGEGSVTGLAASFTISYNTFYAVYVHEMLNLKHDPPTCAKYLERAVRETLSEADEIIRGTFSETFGAF